MTDDSVQTLFCHSVKVKPLELIVGIVTTKLKKGGESLVHF